MPNPFTPPPEGAPRLVKEAWTFLQQKWDREQIAHAALERVPKHAPRSVVKAAEDAQSFAEQETNIAVDLFLDELRFAASDISHMEHAS